MLPHPLGRQACGICPGMRRRIDIWGQLPQASGPRWLTLASLAAGGVVALGLTGLILVFLATALSR